MALASFALLATSCAQGTPLDTLSPEGPIARQIDGLWKVVFYLAIAVFVLVEGLLVISLFRFRQRKGDTELPRQTHGNSRLELAWTIAPALLLAVLAVPTVLTIFALAREKPNSLHIEVTGTQWWWRYDYPDFEGLVTANELHIPAGRPIRLELKSADIIHSFWAPRLAGKQDVTPGRTNYLNIEADRPGTYEGACVEYCGLSHANMRLKVIAHDSADFERWARAQAADAAQPSGGLAARGRRIFEEGQCVSCHTIRGSEKATGTTAPDLTHFASRTSFAGGIFTQTEGNLRRWLSDAPAQKPGSKMPAGIAEMGLNEDDITALIAYLRSLR
jgi:cytochrome c oxidase subunit 2